MIMKTAIGNLIMAVNNPNFLQFRSCSRLGGKHFHRFNQERNKRHAMGFMLGLSPMNAFSQ